MICAFFYFSWSSLSGSRSGGSGTGAPLLTSPPTGSTASSHTSVPTLTMQPSCRTFLLHFFVAKGIFIFLDPVLRIRDVYPGSWYLTAEEKIFGQISKKYRTLFLITCTRYLTVGGSGFRIFLDRIQNFLGLAISEIISLDNVPVHNFWQDKSFTSLAASLLYMIIHDISVCHGIRARSG